VEFCRGARVCEVHFNKFNINVALLSILRKDDMSLQIGYWLEISETRKEEDIRVEQQFLDPNRRAGKKKRRYAIPTGSSTET
jgi:hypothetical protein